MRLQDFMHHVLRNCMVVLMIARDEGTSFKIFSTLNGRGVDLAVVDKLKPELLQVRHSGRLGWLCSMCRLYNGMSACLSVSSFNAMPAPVERHARAVPADLAMPLRRNAWPLVRSASV